MSSTNKKPMQGEIALIQSMERMQNQFVHTLNSTRKNNVAREIKEELANDPELVALPNIDDVVLRAIEAAEEKYVKPLMNTHRSQMLNELVSGLAMIKADEYAENGWDKKDLSYFADNSADGIKAYLQNYSQITDAEWECKTPEKINMLIKEKNAGLELIDLFEHNNRAAGKRQ